MDQQPRWERAAIVGIGLLGASLGLALRERHLAGSVVGVARRAETREAARRVGAADEVTGDLAAALRGADLVVLATPVLTIVDQLRKIGPWLAAEALVTDLGSTKSAIAAAAGSLPSPERFVPGHPMAGSHHSGPAQARADLFAGATWLLTPSPKTSPECLAQVEGLASALGARPLVLPPELHDQLVAYTSHLPHALAVALVRTFQAVEGEHPNLARLVAGGFRQGSQVAVGDPAMWRDIFTTNAPQVGAALASLRRELVALEAALEQPERLEAMLRDAAQARARLEQ